VTNPVYNIEINKGYDWNVNISWTDKNTDPISFTGLVLTWTLNCNGTTWILTDGAGLDIDVAAGTLVASLTSTQTAALPTTTSGNHHFDLVDSLSRRILWFSGKISVQEVA